MRTKTSKEVDDRVGVFIKLPRTVADDLRSMADKERRTMSAQTQLLVENAVEERANAA